MSDRGYLLPILMQDPKIPTSKISLAHEHTHDSENVLLSHNREYLIKEFGESTYHSTYNTLSTLATGR